MIGIRFLLVSLLSAAVLANAHNAPCVDYSSVCVPSQEMEPGCHCVLTRPALSKENVDDDFTYKILSQKAVDELNRFFSVNETTPVPVDTTVFGIVHDLVHAHLMTFPTSLVDKVVWTLDDWLTSDSITRLIIEARCEVINETTDLQGDPPPTRPDRAFRVTRALRYDIEGEGTTLIALASDTSDFVLTKIPVRKCKHVLFWKECWTEFELRTFDAQSKANWMKHVNNAMVGTFRREMANLLV